MKNNKTVLVVGSIALDSLETIEGNRKNLLGGSATYFSVSASKLSKVKMVGVVGLDFPESAKDILLSCNIDMTNLQTAEGKTFRWGGKYSSDFSSRETLFTKLGVFEFFSPIIANADRCVPLVFLANIQPKLQLLVAEMMDSPEYIISDTMNLWIDMFPKELENVIQKSNVFFINHEESNQLLGTNDVEKAANFLLKRGPLLVVIKMGENGAYVAHKDFSHYIPAFPLDHVIDPTGAGDSFAGGFLGYLANNNNPNFIDAAIYGSAMASFCVQGFGVEKLLHASVKELEERVNKIKKLMTI